MKSTASLVVFAIIIAFSAGSAVAESNPLLTVFEGIEIGMKGSEVIGAWRGYEDSVHISREYNCYCSFFPSDNPRIVNMEWTDKIYLFNEGRPGTPVAFLTIELDKNWDDPNARIVKATYIYKFLKLKKVLLKQ